ncbi:MAG: hypothetical protein KatS3mg087_1673 [Patescibacteria group bacterium]|nr:MAG: hypothetical protein KatS3mg087_1673 [Patescibacteria group bacterium]
MTRALEWTLRLRQNQLNFITLSGRFLLNQILLSTFFILWRISETSGVFGKAPSTWVSNVGEFTRWLLVIHTVVGVIFVLEAIARMVEQQNAPISPLILNYTGMLLTLGLALRVHSVLESEPLGFSTWANLFIVGLSTGGVYALIALGYTLVYGILFMINFAHGEVMMFGAYTGYFATQYLTSGGHTFEDGSVLIASILIPLIIGILFLPLERLITGYAQRTTINFQTPDWLFTFFSVPVRFTLGFVIGYGALVGLGGYAPHLYLIAITISGVLFAMVCGMIVSMALSVVLERVAYRPLRFAPRLVPLISAIGASIFLQQVALRIFGPQRKTYSNPRLLQEPFRVDLGGTLGTLVISKVGIVIVIVSVLLMFLLYVIVQRTKIGRAMRAVAQDKNTAALMGIDVDRVIVFTFMLGAALAGAAGVMLGFRSDKIDFKFGFTPGLKAFTAAVLGGIGSIPGAMFGGFFLGIVESIGPALLGFDDKWRNAIAFGILVLVLIFRPSGLFGAGGEVKKV